MACKQYIYSCRVLTASSIGSSFIELYIVVYIDFDPGNIVLALHELDFFLYFSLENSILSCVTVGLQHI